MRSLKLNQIADNLRAQADKIMSIWEARANSEVRAAEDVPSLVLRDMLPRFIQQLADTIAAKKRWASPDKSLELERAETAQEHGKQRADTEAYKLTEVILEFHILREVIFEVLEEAGPLPGPERDIIVNSFEQMVNESACVFADLQLKNHDRFTLTLVHDFRGPLNVIKMAAQVARLPTADTKSLHWILEKIDKNAQKLEAMIRALLDVSRIKAGKGFIVIAREMSLDTLIKTTVAQLTDAYGDRFEARVNEQIVGSWDSEGLRRIIENLAVNAFKYGDATSPIIIKAEKIGDRVRLTIHNDGNPIPVEEHESIFEEFARASTATERTGWGLGLSLVKGMAKAHNGTVHVESSPANGTDFVVELPMISPTR